MGHFNLLTQLTTVYMIRSFHKVLQLLWQEILEIECLMFMSCTDVGKQSIRRVMLVNHSDDFLLNE